MTERELLTRTAEIAADYVDSLGTRGVGPRRAYREMPAAVDRPVPEGPSEPLAVVEELAATLEPGITAMGSGRYFGFVIGGALPASVAVDWLVSAWDQNAGLAEPTPGISSLEAVAGRWVLELLGLPVSLLLRLRHRLPDGARHLPRGRPPRRARPRRVEPPRRRADGRAGRSASSSAPSAT